MFSSEICKNGHCSNLYSTYTCLCRSGFYYNHLRHECLGEERGRCLKLLLFILLRACVFLCMR